MNIDEYLTTLYFKKENINKSEKELYELIKQDGKKITHNQIKEFLKKQEINQVYEMDKKPEKFTSIVAEKIRSEYQMDIMIYDRYEFNKYKYILVVVDIYSRYANIKGMTNRETKTILDNVNIIFKEMGKPEILSCDNEFNSFEFNKYCKMNNIQVNFSIANDIQKNSIVERLNRTIAGYIKRLRSIGIYNWVKELPEITNLYNNKYHRTIRDTPFNIFIKGHKNKQDIFVVLGKFKIGDNVRIKIKKKVFDKGDLQIFSNDVYKIVKKDGRKFLLSDGKYYSSRTLKLANQVVKYIPTKKEEKEEFIKNKKEKDIIKELKKEGLTKLDILEGKREKKKKIIYDV